MTPEDIPLDDQRPPWTPRPPLGSIFCSPAEKKAWLQWYILSGLLVPFYLLLIALFRLLPLSWVDRLGAQLGRFIVARQRRTRPFAQTLPDRIGAIDPGLTDPDQRHALAEDWAANLGRTHARYPFLDRCTKGARFRIHGRDNVWPYREADQRVLIVGVHLGDWEAITLFAKALPGKHRPFAVYQPQTSNFENWLTFRNRQSTGIRFLPPKPQNARHISRILKARTADLTLFLDDVVDGESRFPYFGRAPYPQGNLCRMARISRKYRLPVVPTYLLRGSDPGIDLHILPAITPDSLPVDNYETALKNRLNLIYEDVIRQNVSQWYMLKDTPLV